MSPFRSIKGCPRGAGKAPAEARVSPERPGPMTGTATVGGRRDRRAWLWVAHRRSVGQRANGPPRRAYDSFSDVTEYDFEPVVVMLEPEPFSRWTRPQRSS